MMPEREDHDLIDRVGPLLRQPESMDPTFEARLLHAVREAAARGDIPWMRRAPAAHRTTRGWRWAATPRPFMVSPLAVLAAAAALTAIVVGTTLALGGGRANAPRGMATVPSNGAPQPAGGVVRFVVAAPGARSVTLVGDFNAWNTSATPLARDPVAGVWTVTVSLEPGTYQYAFVVDGTAWLADPSAALELRDEFGTPSSLVTVRPRST